MQLLVLSILWILDVATSITVYGQIPLGVTSARAPGATVAAAYNDTVLNPPPIPVPAPATAFTLTIPSSSASVTGLSIPIHGTFFGFSIEMSVITQLCGSLQLHSLSLSTHL
jgi:hypothetical protein